jgi:tRNA-Thr(GGU) m(6)t(6)A37 methyltransferase TsaA
MRLWPFRRTAFERPDPPGEVTLAAVGYVRNNVAKPQPRGWENVASVIEILPEHEAKLLHLDRYSHIIVTFYMDLAPGAPEKPEQLTLKSGNQYGILATRSQLRPNHLGVSAVALVAVDGATLRVHGLDAVDGTPVLDIKPYLPEYDAIPSATIPGRSARG